MLVTSERHFFTDKAVEAVTAAVYSPTNSNDGKAFPGFFMGKVGGQSSTLDPEP